MTQAGRASAGPGPRDAAGVHGGPFLREASGDRRLREGRSCGGVAARSPSRRSPSCSPRFPEVIFRQQSSVPPGEQRLSPSGNATVPAGETGRRLADPPSCPRAVSLASRPRASNPGLRAAFCQLASPALDENVRQVRRRGSEAVRGRSEVSTLTFKRERFLHTKKQGKKTGGFLACLSISVFKNG